MVMMVGGGYMLWLISLLTTSTVINFSYLTYGLTIQENAQNLVDSLATNRSGDADFYRKNLKLEVDRERQAFDKVEEEMRFARMRLAHRRSNLYSKSNVDVVAIKRNTAGENRESAHRQSDTGVQDDSNGEQSSVKGDAPSPTPPSAIASPSIDPGVDGRASGEQSSVKGDAPSPTPLPQIPEPGQTFEEVKMSNMSYVIVDKTSFIQKLIDNKKKHTEHKIYFLARPRTFGKSFFLSTVAAFLQGKRDFFLNSSIVSRGNTIEGNGEWTKNPIVFIDFSLFGMNSAIGFRRGVRERIKLIAKNYSIIRKDDEDDARHVGTTIRWLITALKSKYDLRVSILIDDFDFPLRMSPTRAKADIEKELKMFCAEIKAAAIESELWLVLILGVNKLQALSTLNGLETDITLDDTFSSIMGFSAHEVKENFEPHVDQLAKGEYWDTPNTFQTIESRYGGYRFSVNNKAPVLLDTGSVCACLRTSELKDFESRTEAIDVIVGRMIKEHKGIEYFKYYCISKNELNPNYYAKYEKELPLHVVMFCNGYLTIRKSFRDDGIDILFLSYPNEGIEKRIERGLPVTMRSRKGDKYNEQYRVALIELFQDALEESDMKAFVDLLIPEAFPIVSRSLQYEVSTAEKEFVATGYMMYRALKTVGLDCSEGDLLRSKDDGSECGDLDLVIFATKENMPHYAISSKFEKNPLEAFFQLLKYVVTKVDALERIFDSKPRTDVINLVGLVVKNDPHRHRTISGWILVPYTRKEKKIWINKSEASYTNLKLSLSRCLKYQTYFESNKEKFVM